MAHDKKKRKKKHNGALETVFKPTSGHNLTWTQWESRVRMMITRLD